jgi:hypothetical protein
MEATPPSVRRTTAYQRAKRYNRYGTMALLIVLFVIEVPLITLVEVTVN